MKKIKLLVCVVIIAVFMLAMCSCMDANTLNSYLGMLGLGTHTCADANGDTACDTCGAYVAPQACTSHIDNNGDGVCDNAGCNGVVLVEMLDATFADRTFTYDGKVKKIEVKGAPEGAVIEYNVKNFQTKAGKYEITATITADGYVDCELTATLTIKPRTININWADNVGPFPANGKIPTINYTLSDIIEGDTVEVEFDFGGCDFTELGEDFEVVAKSKNSNYQINTSGGVNKHTFSVGDRKSTRLNSSHNS